MTTHRFMIAAVTLLLAGLHATGASGSANAADSTVLDVPRELTLADAVALALARNPELAPFAPRERASEARALQAGKPANPSLSLMVEDVLGTGAYGGAAQSQTTLQLSQVIELGGKRGARRAAAALHKGINDAEYESKRVEILALVTERFIGVVANQHSYELALTTRQLADDALRTVRERVKAGKGSALDEKKAEIVLARVDVLVEEVEHELNAARKMLAASWGGEPSFERATADLFARPSIPPFEEIARRIANSPEMQRSVSEQNLRAAEIRLADARRMPDVSLDAGFRHLEATDDQTWVFGLSLPLPVFDRNQGGRAEARALLDATDAERSATEFRLRNVLLGFYEEVLHDAHVMEGLESRILPIAEDVLALSQEGYAQGRFSYLDVLDAQRTVFDVRQEHIRTATSFHQFLLEIERLTGQPIGGAATTR